MTVHADEPGPVSSVLAAADQALWDLSARRQRQPLRRLLNAQAADRIPAYASGLNPSDGSQTVAARCKKGHRNIKRKIGFSDDKDKKNVFESIQGLSANERLFVDANQRWNLQQSIYAANW